VEAGIAHGPHVGCMDLLAGPWHGSLDENRNSLHFERHPNAWRLDNRED